MTLNDIKIRIDGVNGNISHIRIELEKLANLQNIEMKLALECLNRKLNNQQIILEHIIKDIKNEQNTVA